MPLIIILLQPKMLTSQPFSQTHAFSLGYPTCFCHYLIFISTTRDFTCHTISTLSFTDFTRINRQVSMLIQSLSSLGNRVSAGQFLIIVKLTQQKSKAIQSGRLPYSWALSTSRGECLSTLASISPRYLCITDYHSFCSHGQ